MAFVAGTLVHTDKGMVPIDKLKVGDMVLSRDENNPEAELVYRKVIKTKKSSEKHPIMTPIQGVYCTENHPFWVDVIGDYDVKTQQCEYKPQWLAAEYITSSDKISMLYPIDNLYRLSRGRYYERLGEGRTDSYSIGGRYLVATSDPNVALYIMNDAEAEEGPGQMSMGVVDFSTGEPLEVYTNADDLGSYLGYDNFYAEAPKHLPYKTLFLDKNNTEHQADIIRYGTLWDNYLTPDWDNDLDAVSSAHTDYVYNIKVEDTHTYFIGSRGIWVRNIM